jgi:hypothetical protein
MIKRFIAAVVAVTLGLALALVGATAAQAQTDASISVTPLAAICDGPPTYTDAQFTIANATWNWAIDNNVGTHTRTATASPNHVFSSNNSTTASVQYTVSASLGNTQSTNPEAPCYVSPSTVTFETVVWSMPSPNDGTVATYPQVGALQYKGEKTQTLDVAVPTSCGTQYQIDVYVQKYGSVDNTAAIDALFTTGLAGPNGAQDSKYLAGQPGNPGDASLGQAKLVKNPDCPASTPVTPVFPAPTQPSCGAGGALPALPTDQPGLTFSWAPDGVTMIASLKTGFTFANGAATSKAYDVPAGPIGYQSTNSEGACYVPPTACVVNTTIPWSAESGDVSPVQRADGLQFKGPHTAAMDYYQRVTAGNMQGLTGMTVTYAPGGSGYQALVVVEVNTGNSIGSGTNHYATISSVLGATDTSGTFNVQNGLWYTNKIDPGQPGGMDHPISWAAMTALMPQNTLLSAPSLHQQTQTGADAISVVTSLSSSCGSTNFVPPLTNVAAGDPTNTNQLCTDSQLVGGVITVIITPHVTYQITGSNGVVPFDGTTGTTAPLAPGTYTVAVAADTGYTLTSSASFPLTITPYDGVCGQLVDHPIVTPVVTSSQLGCTADGSYTLSNDLNAPTGVIWTVDGSPVAPGTYSVTSARTVKIHADPNGPNYGFSFGQQQDWTLTFVTASLCSTLPTLALHDGTLAFTGSNPTGLLVLAGLLGLLGLALILARRLRTLR